MLRGRSGKCGSWEWLELGSSPKQLHCNWGVTRQHLTLQNFHMKSGIHCSFSDMNELTMLHINQDVTKKKLSA
jgi:hypothetical protein